MLGFATALPPPLPQVPMPRLDEYDSYSSSDSNDTARARSTPRSPFFSLPHESQSLIPPSQDFLFPPSRPSGRSSLSSTACSTPIPSRSTSPIPQFFSSTSSSTSDTDSEFTSPPYRAHRPPAWRDDRRRWWSLSRRRRKRDGRCLRSIKWALRLLVRHPLFPQQPITIVLTLILLTLFGIFIALILIHILNPDHEHLPWRAYCGVPGLPQPIRHIPASTPAPFTYSQAAKMTTSTFPPPDLDSLAPAGVFLGVFSTDSGIERRMLIRTTYASHQKSRNGAGDGDGGAGTSRFIVRFILGLPRGDWERRIKLEMEMYNDIVILPAAENMNGGKTYTFFSWASINAWVPPIYDTTLKVPEMSYANRSSIPPPLAPHDPVFAWRDQQEGHFRPWVRPDFVVKTDDDSFVMLAELEARLRVELHPKVHIPSSHYASSPSPIPGGDIQDNSTSTDGRSSSSASTSFPSSLSPSSSSSASSPSSASSSTLTVTDIHESLSTHSRRAFAHQYLPEDPLIYYGYMVTSRLRQFMAGELYGLSWNLVEWVAKEPAVKKLTKGAEDQQTAKWMKLHPRATEVRWVSEKCWIYDHPRSGTVYSHGFLFPSEVTRIMRGATAFLEKAAQDESGTPTLATTLPTNTAWAHSSVSTFGVRYAPPFPDLSTQHSVEALVEGSDMSMIHEGGPMFGDYAWRHREGRKTRYEGKRIGGTVVVHFIKKHMWFLETAMALLEGEELSESEQFQEAESKAIFALSQARIPVPPSSPLTPEQEEEQRRKQEQQQQQQQQEQHPQIQEQEQEQEQELKQEGEQQEQQQQQHHNQRALVAMDYQTDNSKS